MRRYFSQLEIRFKLSNRTQQFLFLVESALLAHLGLLSQMMAKVDFNYWRFFLLVPSMATVCMAWGHHQERENVSTNVYNPFNRSVILNRASEHYLALIFNEYSDNFTRRISTTRFEDLLHDLNLGDDFMIQHQKVHKQHESTHTRSNNVLSTAGMQRRSKRRGMDKFDEFSQGIELKEYSTSARKRQKRDAVVNPSVKVSPLLYLLWFMSYQSCFCICGQSPCLIRHGSFLGKNGSVRIFPSLSGQRFWFMHASGSVQFLELLSQDDMNSRRKKYLRLRKGLITNNCWR